MTEGRTLAELDVKPGDVVRYDNREDTIGEWDDGLGAWGVEGTPGVTLIDGPVWHLVSRSNEAEDAEDNRICDERQDGPFVKVAIDGLDKPKTWGEMTDAEKGALLLAAHDGQAIQYTLFPHESAAEWRDAKAPCFADVHGYRIRIEPVRSTVTMWGINGSGVFTEAPYAPGIADVKLTFDTIDGNPIPGTYTNEAGDVITMEECE